MNPSAEPVASQLADLLSRTTLADFDSATLTKAKLHLLDTLGVGLAGSRANETQLVRVGLGLEQSSGAAVIWGTRQQLCAREASLVNGVAAHAYELDDSGGCDHSGAVVLPAALSLLDRVRDGGALLRAVILGYEVARRVLEACGGYESHNERGWHSTGTCGVFGAAITAGLLLELSPAALCSALGIAASFAGGTWAFIADGSQTKKLHSGLAAQGGVSAALLAAQGFSGPRGILDATGWGNFLPTFNPQGGQPAALLAGFGQQWRINRCSIKPYATCRGTHAAIDALRQLQQRYDIQSAQVARIQVDISRFQFGMCGGKQIDARAAAQMSIAYALAAQLEFGEVGLAELADGVWSGNWLARWLDCITLQIDEQMAAEAEPVITLTTHAGDMVTACVPYPLGSPQYPMSAAQILDKYRRLAGQVLPAAQVEALIDWVMNLETQRHPQQLGALLRG